MAKILLYSHACVYCKPKVGKHYSQLSLFHIETSSLFPFDPKFRDEPH